MLGAGEIILLLLAFLFAGGAASRLAKWAFFRRASVPKQALWAVAEWIKKANEDGPDDATPVVDESVVTGRDPAPQDPTGEGRGSRDA